MARWSIEEYEEYIRTRTKQKPAPMPQAKPDLDPKYHNEKAVVDGIKFDSKLEARRDQELQLMKASGEIKWYNRQPSFVIGRANGRDIRYRPDFMVCGCIGVIWVEDAKGFETKDWKLKAAMFREKYPDLELVIIK